MLGVEQKGYLAPCRYRPLAPHRCVPSRGGGLPNRRYKATKPGTPTLQLNRSFAACVAVSLCCDVTDGIVL